MKLYYMQGASSLSTRILFNEIDLDCEYEEVNRQTKKIGSDIDFYSISNKGLVPVLEIAKGKTISDSLAIMEYLADLHTNSNLLPPVNSYERYEALSWLHFISYEISAPFTQINHSVYPEEIVNSIIIPGIMSKLEICEKQLAHNEYISGNEFTVADSLLVVMIFWAFYYKLDISQFPNLVKYFDRLKARPSILKSFDQEGLLGMI